MAVQLKNVHRGDYFQFTNGRNVYRMQSATDHSARYTSQKGVAYSASGAKSGAKVHLMERGERKRIGITKRAR